VAIAIVRISKSKAAWETSDPEQVMKANFRDRYGDWDLRPSVYEVVGDPSELPRSTLRVHVEHVASLLSPPAKGAMHHVDLNETSPKLSSSPGQTCFAFANNAHREVLLDDEGALRAFVDAILAKLPGAARDVTLDQVLDHINESLGEAAWIAASANAKVASWVELVRKKRKK
jgi:hypothetical protein